MTLRLLQKPPNITDTPYHDDFTVISDQLPDPAISCLNTEAHTQGGEKVSLQL